MFRVYNSNCTENLFGKLSEIISKPPENPMEPENIVVQNMGMARWLAQKLALAHGIAANVTFMVPACFVWRIYRLWLPDIPDEAGFDKEALKWKIMKILGEISSPRHPDRGRLGELLRYFEDDQSGLKRYQLSGTIADVFDRYLIYRTETILSWEEGTGGDWQAELWRLIVKETPGTHAAALYKRFREAVKGKTPPKGRLPARVSIFGLNTLAPLHLNAFDVLSHHTDVHLFFLNPCREYWVDIVDEKSQARRRARWRKKGVFDFNALLDLGNPLLASMGHTGQGFMDQLLNICDQPDDLFADVEEKNLLTGIQKDILDLIDRGAKPVEERPVLKGEDRSIQVHACHSPMREIQVLHDSLLEMFSTIPDLTPRDIVVMAPDIDSYAPYVEAVFGTAPREHFIPWSIADRRIRMEEPLIEAALELLGLPDSRLTASDVLSLLEIKAISRHFGVGENALECIRMWVEESGIRWGSDKDMRKAFGLPGDSANTWKAGLERLFAGYALPPRELFFKETLSYPDVEVSDSDYLGALQAIIDRLNAWRKTLSEPATAITWQDRINAILNDFFDPDTDEEQGLQEIRRLMDELSETTEKVGYDIPLDSRLMKACLQSRLSSGESVRRFLRGGVTFCNMVPMRSIPFRVVCLLGMNGDEFPRIQRAPKFDLIAKNPRLGDRFRRNDDRYLFLEALLSARDVFYISYIGNNVQDNSERVPSVVVSELLDYIWKGWRTGEPAGKKECLIVRHPLQPFSPLLFNGDDSRLFTYDDRWVSTARVSGSRKAAPFIAEKLPDFEPEGRIVEIDDLVRFFENPSAWILKNRLGIYPGEKDTPPLDEEPFNIEGLDLYGLETELLRALLKGEDILALRKRYRASGKLPHGKPGDMVFDDIVKENEALADAISKEMGIPVPVSPPKLNIELGDITLRGRVPELTVHGRFQYRPATIKAKDRLRLWIYHLALCAASVEGVERHSIHIAKDKIFRLKSVDNPERYLRDFVEIWLRGQTEPVPFFPETSWAYAEARNKAKGKNAVPRSRYLNAWDGAYNKRPDSLDPAVRIVFRGREPLQEKEFREIAWCIYGPVFKISDETKVKR